MDETQARSVRIIGARCTTQDELHAYLKRKLGFPDYYGGNLAALADCLSEMGVPVSITVCLNEDDLEPGMQAYMLRFVQTCAREALANENITFTIEHW